MVGRLVVALGFACACASSGRPPRASPGEPPRRIDPPGELRAQIELAERVGQQLYVLDTAAALATDAVLAQLGDAPRPAPGGWIAAQAATADGRPEAAFLVFFYDQAPSPALLFRVHVPMARGARPAVHAPPSPVPVPPGLLPLVRARATALGVLRDPGPPWNPVILPGAIADREGILVYLLQGTTRPEMVLGIHHRVLVSDDGSRVLAHEPLSKSHLRVPLDGRPEGGPTAGLWVTHLVSDTPIETHVFLSRLHRKPLFVGTRRGLWRVDEGKIDYLGPIPAR